jgi:hypothetical protein
VYVVAPFFNFDETNPRFVRELVFVSHRVQNIARKGRWEGERGKWLEGEGRKSRKNGDYGIYMGDKSASAAFGGRECACWYLFPGTALRNSAGRTQHPTAIFSRYSGLPHGLHLGLNDLKVLAGNGEDLLARVSGHKEIILMRRICID